MTRCEATADGSQGISAYIASAATNHLICASRKSVLFRTGQEWVLSVLPSQEPEAKTGSKRAKPSPPNRKCDLDRSRHYSFISCRATSTAPISSIPSISTVDTPKRQRQSPHSCPYHLRIVQSVSQVGRCSSTEPCRVLHPPNQYRTLS